MLRSRKLSRWWKQTQCTTSGSRVCSATVSRKDTSLSTVSSGGKQVMWCHPPASSPGSLYASRSPFHLCFLTCSSDRFSFFHAALFCTIYFFCRLSIFNSLNAKSVLQVFLHTVFPSFSWSSYSVLSSVRSLSSKFSFTITLHLSLGLITGFLQWSVLFQCLRYSVYPLPWGFSYTRLLPVLNVFVSFRFLFTKDTFFFSVRSVCSRLSIQSLLELSSSASFTGFFTTSLHFFLRVSLCTFPWVLIPSILITRRNYLKMYFW